MHPSDIRHLHSLSTPALAGDGSFAIVAASRPDEAADRSVGQLWRIELDDQQTGGDARPAASTEAPRRRLTRGIAESSPALSADGTVLAFLRPDAHGHPQVHLMDPRGGEPLQVTEAPLGVGDFVLSAEGARLAFLARVPEVGRYGTVEGISPAAEPARRIDSVRWQANGVGWTNDRPRQVFVLDLPTLDVEPVYPQVASPDHREGSGPRAGTLTPTTARQLTAGPDEHTAIALSADGSQVFAVRDRLEDSVRDLRTVLVGLRADGEGTTSETVLLEEADRFTIDQLTALPDGLLALLAHRPVNGRDAIAPDRALWVLDPGPGQDAPGRDERGSGPRTPPRRLTDPDQLELTVAGPLVAVGDQVLVHELTRGRIHLHLVGPDGTVREVLGGDLEAHGAAIARPHRPTPDVADQGGPSEQGTSAPTDPLVVLAAVSTPQSAGELVQVRLAHPADRPSQPRFLTDLGKQLRATGLVVPRELDVPTRDGSQVHGWLAVPEGEGPFPVILMIHGGPFAHYGVSVFDEVQILAAAGYAVAYCNPRGSAGYGRAHGRAIRHRMGTDDHHDVLDFLEGAIAADVEHDAVQDRARLDGSRLGIMGGSYGGFLTAWTIAHDHRFAAAIVERGFLDPVSFQGTSDIGSYFGDEYVGTDPAAIARQSPFAHVGSVLTPTLVIHSEQDLRCPLEQGTRYYSALRRQGVPSSLLVFPGEDHELTRSGRPRHRLQRFDAVLDWWERAFSAPS
ncbi:S9 family peptidase [Brachybacterium endophyticum]|uniref:S9 family peptidase n=1 Tax=Brachybacterium endophyticum TaxID=2182385 RepID=A0A2U2RKE1_9MICO|nr:prolyl oligopeptidase family serine peptidase [Brachybacterium endophyticum]PWH06342.1 S9 family peptidase [Brachybacterium endophyticum]